MTKLVFVVFLWVASCFVYRNSLGWLEDRFNLKLTGTVNWGSVHLFVMLLLAPFAAAFMIALRVLLHFIDKKGSKKNDLNI